MKDALEIVTLAKAVKEKALADAREAVPAGTGQAVDFWVHLVGHVDVFEDQKDVVTAQAGKPWKLLAAALEMLNGVSVEALVRRSEEIREDVEKDLKARTSAALDEIKGKLLQDRKGQVRTHVAVEIHHEAPVLAAALETVAAAA